MQTTKNELKKTKESSEINPVEKILSSASGTTSDQETQKESSQLSKSLAVSLMGLIKDVNKDGVTPETVNASCNAAAQVYKILRLNFEMKKEGF